MRHGQLSGPATRAVMRREFEVFGDARFERLAYISNGHLYNLRKSQSYQRQRTARTRTRPSAVAIGERRKPRPDGQPGFARVDSVHQGDLDGRKGVYEINLVDEVTQYEFVVALALVLAVAPWSASAFSSSCLSGSAALIAALGGASAALIAALGGGERGTYCRTRGGGAGNRVRTGT